MKHLISIIGLGALYALTALFLIYSYHYITSGVATTIHFLYPICVSFLMVVFFKEQKSKSLFLAASLSLIGVALMCWSGGGSIRLMGIGLAALTILTYGIYIVALNQLDIGKLPAEVLTFYVLLGGCVIFSSTVYLQQVYPPSPAQKPDFIFWHWHFYLPSSPTLR